MAEPQLSDKDLAANYGFALAVLNSDGELKDLFGKAVKKGYTPQRFQAELRDTKWFKSRSEAQRKYQILRLTDPSQWAAQIKQTMAALADQWSGMTGQTLTFKEPSVKNGKTVDGSGTLWKIADAALKMGWNEAQIRDTLARAVDWKKLVASSALRGSASGQLQNWRAQASALGLKLTDDWYGYRLRDVNSGNDTDDGVLGLMKKMAKQRYKAFADDIDAGLSIRDVSENYLQSMGNILEISPNQVDVFDSHIQAALTAKDEDGKDAPMSITDFEKRLRQDDRWQFTQNAKESVVTKTMDLVKSMGLAG